jgi:nucleoside-diphosphate-sugar epimerase
MIDHDQGVFVTGGSGALGSRVLRLLEAGDMRPPVVIASRAEPTVSPLVPDRDRYWHLDLEQDIALPVGVQAVLHIAGEKRDEHRMWEVNHTGTRRLIEAAARVGVRRFVYVSSVGVYGAPKHAGLVDESHHRTPGNVYEASKSAGEAAVRELCPHFGMEFVVVQPTNVLAHAPGGSYPLLGLMSAIKSGRFTYFGAGDPWVNYVHVDDAASAIAVALVSGSNGATYIVNTPSRLSALAAWIASELGVSAPARRIPAWLGALMGRTGSALQRVAGRSMPITVERYRELTNTTLYDGEGLSREQGFRYPIGIEAAVRALVKAYRSEGRL